MVDVNAAALHRFHNQGERWEMCRSNWFGKQGNAEMERKCKFLATDHKRAAREARLYMASSPNKVKR